MVCKCRYMFSIFCETKNTNVRQTSIGAMLSQLFGISEPVLFGIQLRYNLRPLIIMLCTSGLGAAVLFFIKYSVQFLWTGSFTILSDVHLSGKTDFMVFNCVVVSVVLCFVLTYLFGVSRRSDCTR